MKYFWHFSGVTTWSAVRTLSKKPREFPMMFLSLQKVLMSLKMMKGYDKPKLRKSLVS